jgi:hypothetical protein
MLGQKSQTLGRYFEVTMVTMVTILVAGHKQFRAPPW